MTGFFELYVNVREGPDGATDASRVDFISVVVYEVYELILYYYGGLNQIPCGVITGVQVGSSVVLRNSSLVSVNSLMNMKGCLCDNVYILGKLGSIQSSSSASSSE